MRGRLNVVLIIMILLVSLTIIVQFNSNNEIIKITEANSKGVFGVTGMAINENSEYSFFGNLLYNIRNFFRLTGNVVYISGADVSISNIFPASGINISKDVFFNYTVNVTCNTNDCGDINVSLNIPGGAEIISNGDFETGDKTGWVGTPESDFSIDSTTVNSGTYASKIYAVENACNNGVNTHITQNITLASAGTLHFAYNYLGYFNGGFCDALYGSANCEAISYSNINADFLISDTSSVWVEKNYSLSSGSHTLTWFGYSWCYSSSNLYVDDICMIDGTGSCLLHGDSPISTIIGTTPLYTNSTTNPKTINLATGESQLVTFYVNATGNIDSINEVFAQANITSNMSIGNTGVHYNLTIVQGPDIISPIFTGINNITIDEGESLNFNINATDNVAIDTYTINDTTNFKINSTTGILENNTNLSIGKYYLNVSVNDTSGNINSEIIYVDIISPRMVSVDWITPNSNSNLTKGEFNLMQFNVSCLVGNCGTINVTLDPLPDSNATIMALSPLRWFANGGNNDYSGNSGNPSATIGSPTLTPSQIPNPSVSQMYYYGGSDEYDYPDSTQINTYANPAGDYFAMSLWFNASVIDDVGNGEVLWGQGGGTNSLTIYVTNDTGSDEVFCTAVEGTNIDYVHTLVNVGELYHLACIYDFAGGTIKMYLDGVLMNTDSTLAIGTDLSKHSGNIAMAGQDANTDDHNGVAISSNFAGYIGEFAYWGVNDNGVLSSANISTIYNNGIATGTSGKSGIVPTGSGTPFYTNATNNPLTTTSLNAGQSETVSFWVNATGDLDSVNEFYSYVNLTSDLSISNETTHYNITIVNNSDTTPPTFTGINNITINEGESLNFNINATDNVAIDTFSVNDTDFSISSSGLLTNTTVLSTGKHYLNIAVNDTSGNLASEIIWVDVIALGVLNVTLISPTGSMANQPQNAFFNATFNVSCTGSVGATCGGVGGRIRYNLSSSSPDTNLPTGSGIPFYTIESNLQNCGTINVGDNSCSLIWQVNATGNINSEYKLDSNFVSTLVSSNNTNDFGIKIISSAISISLSNDLFNINFGNGLTPGDINLPATNNSIGSYNITCHNSGGNCNLTIKGNSNLDDGINSVGIGNISWNKINDNSTKNNFKLFDSVINSSLLDLATQKLFFWLDLPSNTYAGNYKANFTISAQNS